MNSMPSTRRHLLALSTIALLIAAIPAAADVMNGDFENGDIDWSVNAPADWQVAFPPGGGNPDGYAAIQSPFDGPGGRACITQTFLCGDPGGGTECTIGFDFSLEQIDATDGSGRIIVVIDGIESMVVEGPSGWDTVTYVVPCGTHVIELCLEVDPDNNAWRACFDNVRAVCTGPVPSDASSWSSLKALFR